MLACRYSTSDFNNGRRYDKRRLQPTSESILGHSTLIGEECVKTLTSDIDIEIEIRHHGLVEMACTCDERNMLRVQFLAVSDKYHIPFS